MMQPDQLLGKFLSGFQPACVVIAANELGVFDAIAETGRTAEETARRRSLSVKGTQRLLNALAALGIASREGDCYRLQEEWEPYLTANGEHSMQQWIRLLGDLLPLWNQLGTFVRSGHLVKSIMDLLSQDPVKMRDFIDAMHDKALKAPSIIEQEIPLAGYRRLLDIGGGPGTYALEWAKAHPGLRATVFDIPAVLTVAGEYIAR